MERMWRSRGEAGVNKPRVITVCYAARSRKNEDAGGDGDRCVDRYSSAYTAEGPEQGETQVSPLVYLGTEGARLSSPCPTKKYLNTSG